MKKAFKYLSCLACGILSVAAVSCSEEDYTLPAPNLTTAELVEGVAFEVEHDATNPNIIYVKSLLPANYQVAWVTPQGRRTGAETTLKIPFDGTYEVQMGVDTRGGYVWSEPYTFTIDEFCAEFVDHYMWKRVSGGVGQSKTWQLDLALLEDGSSKTTKWTGPKWFWNTNYTWDHLHAANENETTYNNFVDADPWDKANAIDPSDVPADNEAGDNANWYWTADYAGNSWMCDLKNYGYMTLDLIGGANVTITDADGNVTGKGSYMLDVDAHTITFSGVYPLNTTTDAPSTRVFKLLYLSDDAMMILPNGTTAENYSLNYVTKDFFENYVPDAPKEPELPDGWRDDISQTVITSVKWTLSDKNPIDWCKPDGSRMNGWNDLSEYPDWLGTPDPATYAGFSMTLDCNDNTALFSYPDGSSVSCGYTLDDKGIYTFDAAIPSCTIVGWANFATDAENALRIMSIEKNSQGSVIGLWLGALAADKPEYTAYHFVPNAGNSSTTPTPITYAATLSFNDTSTWNQINGETIKVMEGQEYTATVEATWTNGDPLLWLDVAGIQIDHPNADITLLDIKVDGESIEFDDTAISRGFDDDKEPKALRRYICDAWGLASCFPSLDIFKMKAGAEVTFKVTYND